MGNILADLTHAQSLAAELFREVERRNLIRPGETEQTVSDAIFQLGAREFGARKHWHRRVVRSGPNTRLPFQALPPDREIEDDDIVSIDLGPVFGEYEADFGRSYVIGNDAAKRRLCADLEQVFTICRAAYHDRPNMTGAELFEHVLATSAARGWGFGGAHAGHLVGHFPIARAARDAARNRIRPDNHVPMNAPSPEGEKRHWILEVHLLDATGTFGGFYEDLL